MGSHRFDPTILFLGGSFGAPAPKLWHADDSLPFFAKGPESAHILKLRERSAAKRSVPSRTTPLWGRSQSYKHQSPRAFDLSAYLRDWLAGARKAKGGLKLDIDVDPQSFL